MQLYLLARDGSTVRLIGESDRNYSLRLSHDEQRVALLRFEASVGTFDIWLMDAVRGIASRFTSDPASDVGAVWSPDDKEIVFSSSRNGPYNLYRKRGDASLSFVYSDAGTNS
jgi:Tol biopolymer transport system component